MARIGRVCRQVHVGVLHRSPAASRGEHTAPATPSVKARRRWVPLVILLAAAWPGLTAGEWTPRPEPAGPGGPARCTLETERQVLHDGYQTTWAQIQVDERAVRVTSASVLDPGDGDIGLVVDDGTLIRPDQVAGQKTAVFSAQYDRLVDDFKRGLRVRVQLRFWPTWPKTSTYSATFSLLGFTRAYARLADCGRP